MLLVDSLDFNSKVQAQNMVIHLSASDPVSPAPVEGQVYANTTDKILKYHNATAFRNLAMGPAAAVTNEHLAVFDGTTGAYLKSGGIAISSIPSLPIALTDIGSYAQGSIIIGDTTALTNDWITLAAGTPGYVLTMGASIPEWSSPGAPSAHALLGTAHSDTASATVSRGSLIYGNSTPAWDELVVGTNQLLWANGTDTSWSTNPVMASGGGLRTTTTAGQTLTMGGYDIDGVAYVAMITIAAHATQPTMVLRTGHIYSNDGTSAITIADTSGDVTITGNLTVSGDTVTVDVGTVTIEDKLIQVNKSSTTALAQGAGIGILGDANAQVGYMMSGAADNTVFEFNAPGNAFIFTLDINATSTLTMSGGLNVEGASAINQDVTSDATVTFGNIIDSGLTANYPVYANGSKQLTTEQYLAISRGGTGMGSVTQYGVIYASSTTALGSTVAGTTGKYLRAVTTSAPVWSTLTLPDTIAINQMLYASAANVITALSISTTVGTFLRNTTTAGIPAWSTLILPNAAATVGTIMRASATNTISMTTATYPTTSTGVGSFLITTASNVISASTLTLPNAAAQYGILYAATANNMSVLTTVASSVLITNGSGVPSWDTLTGANHLTRIVSISLATAGGSTYRWNHNLNLATDTDIIVQCWGVGEHADIQVYPTIKVFDKDNIDFTFGFNNATGSYKAVLIY